MNNTKQILAIALVLSTAFATAQNNAYVAAESGLSLRDQPDVHGKLLSKLPYGEAIGVLENTDEKLVILDGGEKISGNWVKVETRQHIGYVFNGYLSPTKISKTINFEFEQLQVELKNLATKNYKRQHNLKQNDSLTIEVDLEASPEGKQLTLVNNDYKQVSIFQRYENSIAYTSPNQPCETKVWTAFNTEWTPIEQRNSRNFKLLTFSGEDWAQFASTALEALKPEIIEQCGEAWLHELQRVDNLKDNPIQMTTKRIFLKFIITDSDDTITEKIIEFKLPTNC
ncbi:SH3 domain-containing protein [Winogradskyella rapida]|uniref:SH3 domain-containing protein n=1 Tax=Winogradskyella rapida TaxID=549701 RepID=A0ABW3KTH5_9FLAO